MAATFDPLLPTIRDRLRFALGDTLGTEEEPEEALLEDETYDAMLLQYPDWRVAGIELAGALASRYSLLPTSISISGEIAVAWAARISNWTGRIAAWRAEVAAEAAVTGSSFSSLAPTRGGYFRGEYTGHVFEE